MNKGSGVRRWFFYLLGLVLLALGLVLNSRTSLGVSPIVSIAYCESVIINGRFGDATFVEYCIFVLVEVILHMIMKRYRDIPKDLAQILLSLAFTRFMNIFLYLIPSFAEDLAGTLFASIPVRILFLLIAILLTGVGAAMSLNSHIVPNPGDGIVQTIAEFTNKKVGFVKNCFDISCVLLTTAISFALLGRLEGVGIGTLIAMFGVGRVIAVYNKLTASGE